MSKKGSVQKRYSAEFKVSVIMDMRKHHLGYCETARKYDLGDPKLGGEWCIHYNGGNAYIWKKEPKVL